jgi:hypothetical protein
LYYLVAPIDGGEQKCEQLFSISGHISSGRQGTKSPENVKTVTMQWALSHWSKLESLVKENKEYLLNEAVKDEDGVLQKASPNDLIINKGLAEIFT